MTTFKVGARVRLKYDKLSPLVGTVTEISREGTSDVGYRVVWDNRDPIHGPPWSTYPAAELLPVDRFGDGVGAQEP